jgi:hypothetical protein
LNAAGLRAKRDCLAAELGGHPTGPAAPIDSNQYVADLEKLDELLNRRIAEGSTEVGSILRRIIDRAIVHPAPTGTAPRVRVEGCLGIAAHAGKGAFGRRSLSARRVVAEEGFGLPRRRPFRFECVAA